MQKILVVVSHKVLEEFGGFSPKVLGNQKSKRREIKNEEDIVVPGTEKPMRFYSLADSY